MSKDIKKALEHCVEWNCDNCPNREELGSGEIVCRGRLLPEVLEYVADLEAKLAEKEKTIQAYEKIVEQKDEEIRFANRDKIYIVKQLNDPKDYVLLEDYKKVEQQLAEKDKEIEKITRIVAYKDDMDRSTTINGVKFTNEQIITLQNIDYFADKHNQDKISFAVEQLEKVKENAWQSATDISCLLDYTELAKIIDNQIKSLKGEKK